MKATVLGIQGVNYTSKKTGQPVSGTTLHCSLKDANVFGQAVDSIFVSDNLGLQSTLNQVSIGTVVNVEYNSRGYINDLTIVSQPTPGTTTPPETKSSTK